MSLLTIEVSIDHGRVTPVEPATLPETGRGLLTILPQGPGVTDSAPRFQRWLDRARGSAQVGLSTDQMMAIARGED